MKSYTYLLQSNKLEINKKPVRVFIEKLYVILQVLILSIPLTLIFNFSSVKNLNITWQLLGTLFLLIIIFTFFFKKEFTNKNISLIKNNGSLEYNEISLGKIELISSIIIEEYVSAEAITGIKNIKFSINHTEVTIMKGVNEIDSLKILELIKEFLGNHDLKVIKKIY